MTAPTRDLSAPELWQRSLERSRRRRVTAPQLRRQDARRRRASSAMAAAMIAGPAAQIAAAQPSDGGAPQPNLASESPANRAIGGAENRAAQVELKLGSEGEAVAAVQRKLGVDPADGNFGESTDRVVRVFQGNEGLAVDGIVGPQTWGALFGGALNPAAASSESTPVLIPALAGQEQRTDFAVRRASEKELEGLNVGGADVPKPTGKDSGLAAIEFRLPDGGDAPPAGGGAPGTAEKGAADSTEAERGALSALRNSADSEPATTAPTGATRRLDRGESKPPSSSKPKGDSDSDRGEDKGEDKPHSGSCGDSLKWPTAGKHITSGYGPRWGRTHAGVDIDTGTGDRIKAAACGVVTLMQSSGSSGGYGNYICVKHTSQFVTCYAHLSRFANVKVGDYVHAGETIGYSGCTGTCFGDHLHFETRRGTPYKSSNYSAFDPRPYLSGRSIPGGAVRSSSIGGPDLIEPTPQPEATSTVQAAEADSQR